MQHAVARSVVAHLVADPCFGDRAQLLVSAAGVDELPGHPEQLRAPLIARAAAIAITPVDAYTGLFNQDSVPGDVPQLCSQLAIICQDAIAEPAANLSSIDALAQLWPHVAGDERPALRRAFLTSLARRQQIDGASVSRAILREWQRDQPTLVSTQPSVAGLAGLLAEPTARDAYLALSVYLAPGIDLAMVFRVLGTLAVQELLRRHDPDGAIAGMVAGSVAGERLATRDAPEVMATLAAQFAHRLWWLRHRAGLKPVLTCLDSTVGPLGEAIASGDINQAQRAARVASQTGKFWDPVWNEVGRLVASGHPEWKRITTAAVAIAARQGPGGIAPDDAAALATVLCARGVTDRYRRPTPPCIVAS